jgi:hypothetical protein
MLVTEMINDEEITALLQMINQCAITKLSNPSKLPSIQDNLQKAHKDKIKHLVKIYQASDIQNKLRVSDDDKVMARRAYISMKNKSQ